MIVTVKHIKSGIEKKDHKFFNDFIKFLQKEMPLKDNITIMFLGDKKNGMSTGSRNHKHELKILSKNRMTRDICRTLAHEWVHEHQFSISKKKKGPDIGGPIEDEANAKAGSIIKKFENKYPSKEYKMYE